MEKNFSVLDITVLKSEELLEEEGLSKIIGGKIAKMKAETGDCQCKCTGANCYEET
ncbi:MAG: hypothetical protein LBP63_09800 [Prevotellaceae bacterium]|jgi:hypothetical protein|nr:hypothetical protein [Prevotellaceae bacterium]